MADDERHDGAQEAELLENLRETSIKTHVAQLRAIHRLKEAGSGGCADATEAPPCPPGSGPDEHSVLSEMVFDAVKAQLASYQGLLKLGDHGDRLFRMLRDRVDLRRASAAAKCEVLEVAGAKGGWTDPSMFCVVNRLRRSVAIDLSAGDFSALDKTGTPINAKVEFSAVPPIPDPDKEKRLAPAESRMFALRIYLDAASFASNFYAAILTVRLDGCVLEERVIRLQVR